MTWVILTCFLQKCYLFSNSRLVCRHNDVIMGNMEGLVTLVFFKIESKNLISWEYFDAHFSKSYIFPNSKLLLHKYDVIIGIFQGLLFCHF